jgi:hypothetical protein
MSDRLLDRQVSLLAHLTSRAAIFGADGPVNRAPPGIHPGLLHLEARFSHEKRMAKIKWVLPRTFELMGHRRDQIIRDFVESCPPVSISRIENARQFHDFLSSRWSFQEPEPPCLLDVAACELAYASVRAGSMGPIEATGGAAERGVRRRPNVIVVRCRHDVRAVLEGCAGAAEVAERDTPVAISMPPGANDPIMSQLSPDLFELLEMLDDFFDFDELSELPRVSGLLTDLVNRGLIEVRP